MGGNGRGHRHGARLAGRRVEGGGPRPRERASAGALGTPPWARGRGVVAGARPCDDRLQVPRRSHAARPRRRGRRGRAEHAAPAAGPGERLGGAVCGIPGRARPRSDPESRAARARGRRPELPRATGAALCDRWCDASADLTASWTGDGDVRPWDGAPYRDDFAAGLSARLGDVLALQEMRQCLMRIDLSPHQSLHHLYRYQSPQEKV